MATKVVYIIPPGTAEAYQKCIDADPNGPYAPQAKAALDNISALSGGVSTQVGFDDEGQEEKRVSSSSNLSIWSGARSLLLGRRFCFYPGYFCFSSMLACFVASNAKNQLPLQTLPNPFTARSSSNRTLALAFSLSLTPSVTAV